MKVTIEIPNFEIWGNNDETPTDFISEIKERIIQQIVIQTVQKIRDNNYEIKNKLDDALTKIKEEGIRSIDDLSEYHQKKVDEFIAELKQKSLDE